MLELEVTRADPDLEGRCPRDAERLRSREAVEAYGMWLYALVRLLQPRVVLETGVQNGCSTELILWAIHRNGTGRLYSIDSGPTSTDGSHATAWHQTKDGIPGRDILHGLRPHWDLTVGLTREELPGLCRQVGIVDIFWHDSDHSAENVRFEFSAVEDHIPSGGLLALHDFQGQPVGLDEATYRLVVPQRNPYLRIWRKA